MAGTRRLKLAVTVTAVVVTVTTPASAQTIGLPGVGDLVTLDDDCVDVDDLTLAQLAALGADACVSDDGVVIDVDAYLADQEVPTDPVTDAVEDAATTATAPVRRATGGSGGGDGDGSGAPSPAPSEPPTAEAGPADGGTREERTAPRSPAAAPTGGVVDRPSVAEQRERARQLAAVRALRADLARGVDLDSGVAGPVVPLGGPTATGDLASPQVAEGRVVPGVDERLAPEVGAGDEEALLASSSPAGSTGEVPLALQLLAAALVLASGAVWTIARRELGGALPEEL